MKNNGSFLPNGWRRIQVKDICSKIDYGYTAKANPSLKEPKFLRITDIQDGNVNWDETPGCEIDPENEKKKNLQSGDIVFARTGSVGKSYLIVDPPRAVFASYLIRLQIREIATPEYVYHFFQSNDYWQQIGLNVRGGVQSNVNATRLGNLTLPLPPLSEQKRIAAILNDRMADIVRARAAAEAQLEAAEALSAAYLRETFKSKEAKEWRWPQLKEFAGINPRRPRDLKRIEEAPTTFVPMPSVDGTSGNISDPLEKPFGEVRKGYTYFEENDVLFAKITPCMQNGKHVIARNLVDGIGFGTTEFHVIRSGDEVIPEWIHLYIRQPSILNEAATHFTGSVGQRRVPPYFLEDLAIPLPPLSEQKRIAATLKERMADIALACTAIKEKLEAINQLPSTILRKAFNGEL